MELSVFAKSPNNGYKETKIDHQYYELVVKTAHAIYVQSFQLELMLYMKNDLFTPCLTHFRNDALFDR